MSTLRGADPVVRLQEPRVCGLLFRRPAGTGAAHWEAVCLAHQELCRLDSRHGGFGLTPAELRALAGKSGYTFWVVTTPGSAAAAGAAASHAMRLLFRDAEDFSCIIYY